MIMWATFLVGHHGSATERYSANTSEAVPLKSTGLSQSRLQYSQGNMYSVLKCTCYLDYTVTYFAERRQSAFSYIYGTYCFFIYLFRGTTTQTILKDKKYQYDFEL